MSLSKSILLYFLFFVVVSFAFYSFQIQTLDLSNTPVKYALGVAYPHPPLIRSLISWSQLVFGFNNLAARLPVLILGALTVGLLFIFLIQQNLDWWAAIFLTLAFAGSYPWAHLIREGLINPLAAFFWLLSFWAIVSMEKDFSSKKYHWLFLLSLIGGLWSQLEQVLFLPVYFFVYFKNYKKIMGGNRNFFIAILGLAALHVLLVFFWFITNPLSVGDFLENILHQVSRGSLIEKLLFSDLSYLMVPIVALWIFYLILIKGRLTSLFAQSLFILTLTVFSYIASYPEPHYAGYAVFILIALLFLYARELNKTRGRLTCLALMILALFTMPLIYRESPDRYFFSKHQKELDGIFASQKKIIGLGRWGYEAQYYLPVPIYKWPENPKYREAVNYVVVFQPASLNNEERERLKTMTKIQELGDLQIYQMPPL